MEIIKEGDRVLIELPIKEKVLEARFKSISTVFPTLEKNSEYIVVTINEKDWIIPKSCVFTNYRK